MADQTSTVIIDVTINQADALTRAKSLNDRIIELKDNQDKLKASGNQLGTTYKDNAQQIRQLESETKAYIALSKNNEGSVNSLRAQITLLTNQFNALSKSERETGTAGQALQKQLKSLNEEERKASQSAGNFKTSVGSYTEAIRGATQNMLPFGSETARTFAAINSLSGAFKGAGTSLEVFKTALATSGVGLIILAVGSLVSYLSDLDTVTDKASESIGGLKAALGELGRSLLNFTPQNALNIFSNIKTAYDAGKKLAEDTHDLEDKTLAQSVKSADAQAKVAQLKAQAMNKALDPKERQKLLEQANQIDAEDLESRRKNADQQIKIIQDNIIATGKLNQAQQNALKKNGVEAALDFQNNLTTQGKVTDKQTKSLAEALKSRDQIQNEYTLRDEKRNNLSERIALQAEAKAEQRRAKEKADAEKLQRALEQIDTDRQQSLLYSSQSTLTIREKEYADIGLDIDKRKRLYQKYNQDTTQLEVEREARLVALRDKFHKEDLIQIQKNLKEVEIANIKTGKSTFGGGSVDEQVSRKNNAFDISGVDQQIEEIRQRIISGEETIGGELEQLMSSLQQKRQTLVDAQVEADSIADSERQSARIESERETQNAILAGEKALSDARINLNDVTLQSYEGAFQTIAQIAGKNSAVGKASFVIEKALAIARIILNAQVAKSNIGIAATAQIAAASEAAIFTFGASLLAIPAIIATAATQEAAIDVSSGFQIAAIAATAIAEVASGFAGGGYVSGPGTGKSDSIPARLSNGEFVMTAEATKMFAPLLSDMNVAGGGKPFATGGLAGSYVPNLSQQIDSNNAVSRNIMSGIKNIKNVVYVESIIEGVNKNEILVEAANF